MNTFLGPRIDIKRALAASAGLIVALSFGACGGGDSGGGDGPGSQELSLVIGNSLPLSGGSRELGESGEKASQVAVEQINPAADSAGADHTIRVVNEDQGENSEAAVDSARNLVNTAGATCLIGPWSTEGVGQVAHDVAIPNKAVEISPVATDDEVTELNDKDLVVSTALPVSMEGEGLSKAIEQALGGAQGGTVNVAASNDTYGDTVTQDFIEAWQGDDGTVGGQVVLAPPPLSDSSSDSDGTFSGSSGSSSVYSAQASEIASGSPDAILLVDDPAGFALLAPSLESSFGWDPETAWGSDQLLVPGLPDELGSEAIDGMRVLAPGAPKGEEATSAFVREFKSASPRRVKLAPYAAQEFDATMLCYLSAVAAGSTDGEKMANELIDITAPGGEPFTWQQLPDAINALEEGKDIDYNGASGPIDMDVHGNPTTGVFDVYQYTSGGLEAVDEVEVSKPNPATP